MDNNRTAQEYSDLHLLRYENGRLIECESDTIDNQTAYMKIQQIKKYIDDNQKMFFAKSEVLHIIRVIESFHDFRLDCADDIPITTEFLKKNGFILKGKLSEHDHDSYYMCYVMDDDKVYEINYTPYNAQLEMMWKNRLFGIVNINQLKQALRLCGLDGLADNLKI